MNSSRNQKSTSLSGSSGGRFFVGTKEATMSAIERGNANPTPVDINNNSSALVAAALA
jgi:hypothetical protein